MQIINKHSLTVVEVTARERREEYSGENWIELQSYITALRAERDELIILLAAALDDNYWHAEGCRGDNACVCWVSKSRAVLAKYAGNEE